MEQQPLNIIMLGRSGCGKGTQAQLLVREFGLEYLGTGDLLRQNIRRDTPLGKRLKEILAAGLLVPSWVAFFVWMERLATLNPEQGVLFDGSPRKLQEAELLDEVLAWFGRANVKVLLIDVPREVAEQRIASRRVCKQCGKGMYVADPAQMPKQCPHCGGEMTIRLEDTPKSIKERLDWFDNEVSRSVEHYRKHGKLIVIDGTKTPDEVHKEIMQKLT